MEIMFSKAFIDGYENRPNRRSDFKNSDYAYDWQNGYTARLIHLQIVVENELNIKNFEDNNRRSIKFLNFLNEVSFVNKLSVPITDEQVQKNLKWIDSLKSE